MDREVKAVSEEEIVKMLDSFAMSETGRMKVKVSEELEAGTVEKKYHHGRCDIGSAFDCGTPFDVLEEKGDLII